MGFRIKRPSVTATVAKLTTLERALAKGSTRVRGGYVTPNGTYMTTEGVRMSAAKIRSITGAASPVKPKVGPGSGEVRTTTRAPKGYGKQKAEALKKLKAASKPLSKKDQAVADAEGIDTSGIGKAKAAYEKLKGSTTAKVTGGVVTATGGTAAILRKSGDEVGGAIDNPEDMAAYLDGNPAAVEAAASGGGRAQVETVQRFQASKEASIEEIGRLSIEADIRAADKKVLDAQIKAAKTRRSAGS